MYPYQPTKVIETATFPDLRVTFNPPPSNEVARHENAIVSAARKAAKAACKAANHKEGSDEYAEVFNATYDDTLIVEKASFVASKLVSWDWQHGKHPAPCDLEGVLSLPYAVFLGLRDVILGYAGGKDAADDEKKSTSQPV